MRNIVELDPVGWDGKGGRSRHSSMRASTGNGVGAEVKDQGISVRKEVV
jgi:hypothetical protein